MHARIAAPTPTQFTSFKSTDLMDEFLNGSFYWNELMTREPEKAVAFFSQTLGWTFEVMEMTRPVSKYWIAHSGKQPVAGIMAMDRGAPTGMQSHWMPYIAVDDIDKRVDKAAHLGAEVLRYPFDVKDVGRIATIREPSGSTVGWVKPKTSRRSFFG